MTVQSIRVNVSTPTEPTPPGRGFYQLEEDTLFVQVGPFQDRRKFFSYIESDHLSLELDRTGRLIFIEVSVPRRRWQIADDLVAPKVVEPADIRWLDFRENITSPRLLTNEQRSLLKLEFSALTDPLSYYLADSVTAQVDIEGQLGAVWVTEITDDLGGQEIGAFRKKLRLNNSYYA